jgi:allantoinase
VGETTAAEISIRGNNCLISVAGILLALVGLAASGELSASADTSDWITGLPREPIHVGVWPGGKKVAVCFVLYVEVWGYGHGPNFRSDMVDRDPDIVDESFRRYAIDWGIARIGRLFKEEQLPLSVALNAQFPEQHPEIWKAFRSLVPNAPVIAHGMNNSTELLPLGRGIEALESKYSLHRVFNQAASADTGVLAGLVRVQFIRGGARSRA